MRMFFVAIALFSSICLQAQTIVNIDGILKDTSFNVKDTYLKEIKGRPYIKIAEAEPNSMVKEMEGIIYSSPYMGRSLKVNIYRPNDDKKHPALLMVHGGGWASGDPSMEKPIALKIAQEGYVTIPVEYRLSPEAQYPAAVHDLKTAVRWLRANADKYGIDTTCIAMSGNSAGGQLASLIGNTNGQPAYEGHGEYQNYSSHIHAVINIDGSLDFTVPENIERVNADLAKGKTPALYRWIGASYTEQKNVWIAASPLFQVTALSAPTCFINSSIPRFHDGRDEMIAKFVEHGIYSEVETIDDTPHPFWLFHPWFDQTVSYMISFMNKQFKGERVKSN